MLINETAFTELYHINRLLCSYITKHQILAGKEMWLWTMLTYMIIQEEAYSKSDTKDLKSVNYLEPK